jgi:hypothetical protein
MSITKYFKKIQKKADDAYFLHDEIEGWKLSITHIKGRHLHIDSFIYNKEEAENIVKKLEENLAGTNEQA